MKTILYFFGAQLFLLSYSHCIEVPGVRADKKTLTSLGIKTLGWQDSEVPQVALHHNYSKVSVQGGQNIGQTQISDLEQIGQETQDQDEEFYQFLTEPPENSQITGENNINSNNGQNIVDNFENSQNILKLSEIMDAENQLKIKQEDDYLSFNQNNEQTTDNQDQNERQPKRFYTLDKPIYVHGIKYPPDPQDVYPQNQPISSRKVESYTECPKSVTGQFVYAYSCNQFLNCWKGRGVVTNCAPGTLFNPLTLECDYVSKVKCLTGPNSGGGGLISDDNEHISCPVGFSGILPHHDDCSKYLSCVNGVEIVMDCFKGTFFNPKIGSCDYSSNVECAGKTFNLGRTASEAKDLTNNQQVNLEQSTQQNGYPRERQGPTKPRETSNAPGSVAPENCDTQQESSYINNPTCPHGASGIFPHPNDCSKYLNCANGHAYVQQCGPGTLFNPVYSVCDHPYNVECNNNHGENIIDVRIRDKTTPIPNTRQVPGEQQAVLCPNGASGIYPHPYICSKFLNCANGQTYIQDCGPGTVFNPNTKVCDHPYNVDCTNHGENVINVRDYNPNSHSEQIPAKTKAVSCPQGASGIYPHPYDCSKFLNCANGQTYVQDCGPGTVFNPNTRVCDYPYNVDCGSNHGENQIDVRDYTPPPQEKTTPKDTLNQSIEQIFGHGSNDYGQEEIENSPSTDLQADYDFGDSKTDEQTVVPGKTPPKNTTRKSVCDSFNFHCKHDECIPQGMVCDGNKDCSNGFDEQHCEKYIYQFTLSPNSILAVREKEKILNITDIYCAKICLETKGFQCKSFSFRKDDGACFLSDSNVGLSGALIPSTPYNYYELTSSTIDCSNLYKCSNKKCIEFKQICDGINDCGDRIDEKGCSAESFGYDIRLGGTNNKHEGRIEVKAFGRWGYICDDRFGLRNADVVCKELGFLLGALEVKSNSFYAKDLNQKDVLYLMDDVTCLGNETTIRDCDFNGWGVHNCETEEVVGVICKTPQETCPKDHWKCDSVQECVPLAFVCDGVFDCTDQSDEGNHHCESSTEMRLMNGKSKFEGRIEIRHHGIWGTICDDDFNDDAAKVVCKALGYHGKAVAKKDGVFGPGSGPIWLDQVFCQGNESALEECIHWNWGEHNCEHTEDVGVVCDNSSFQPPANEPNINITARHAIGDVLPEYLFPERCGYRNDDQFLEDDGIHFRVIKGSIARQGDYPWQASLRIKNKSKPTHWCGAVVISRKFVLTAAHCLSGFSKGAYIVIAGDYNTDEVEGTEQEAYIEEFYIHERYKSGQKMNNDIALVMLKGDGFIFTKDVQPVCLPDADKEYDRGKNCTISGFGSIQSGISGYSHSLRAGWITLQTKAVCQMPHVYGQTITDGMICAGSLDEGVDACDGDSGGPLACLDNGLFTLYGITSWGQHCGHANKPGVYVKISYYRNWIDETMKKHL